MPTILESEQILDERSDEQKKDPEQRLRDIAKDLVEKYSSAKTLPRKSASLKWLIFSVVVLTAALIGLGAFSYLRLQRLDAQFISQESALDDRFGRIDSRTADLDRKLEALDTRTELMTSWLSEVSNRLVEEREARKGLSRTHFDLIRRSVTTFDRELDRRFNFLSERMTLLEVAEQERLLTQGLPDYGFSARASE